MAEESDQDQKQLRTRQIALVVAHNQGVKLHVHFSNDRRWQCLPPSVRPFRSIGSCTSPLVKKAGGTVPMVLVVDCGISPDFMPLTSSRQCDLSLSIRLPEESPCLSVAYMGKTTLGRLSSAIKNEPSKRTQSLRLLQSSSLPSKVLNQRQLVHHEFHPSFHLPGRRHRTHNPFSYGTSSSRKKMMGGSTKCTALESDPFLSRGSESPRCQDRDSHPRQCRHDSDTFGKNA
jgi:hypothetical protein